MPDEQKLLSESEMEEIEAAQVERRKSLEFHQSEYPGLPSPSYINEIDALCQTVRAAWKSFEISEAARGDDAKCYRELLRTKEAENATLREQLAQAQRRILELETEIDTKRGYL